MAVCVIDTSDNLYRTPSSPYVIHSEEAVCQRSMTKYGGAGVKNYQSNAAQTYLGEDLSAVSEVDNAASEGNLPGYW